jgi:mannose/fructose/sorbose-specific phosphotransferase system IIA component
LPTTRVVLVSHGGLAQALLATAQMIVGPTEGVETIALEPGMGTDAITSALAGIVSAAAPQIGVLALLDLLGGSPATACGRVMAVDDRVEVVTGCNLPMLLEVMLARDRLDVHELARLACQRGKEGILDLRTALGEASSNG